MKSAYLFPWFTNMNTCINIFVNLANFINWISQEFTWLMRKSKGSGVVLLVDIIFPER